MEFGPIPPSAFVRAVIGHRLVREYGSDGIAHARIGAQVHSIIRIRQDFVVNQGSDDGHRNSGWIPALRLKGISGDRVTFGFHFATVLNEPSITELDAVDLCVETKRSENYC
jgi:hypothetical protein